MYDISLILKQKYCIIIGGEQSFQKIMGISVARNVKKLQKVENKKWKWGKKLKKRRIWKKYVPMLFAPFFLSGCSLLPAEETGGHVVIVHAVDSVQYDLAEVTREDVELIKDLYCTYQQTKEESLYFGTQDRRVRYVYVKAGENVKKGDLLAELELDDLEEGIKLADYELGKMTILLSQAQELETFDLNVLKKQYDRGELTRAQYEAREQQIKENYKSQITEYEDAIYITKLRLDKMERELAGCRIYAGIDGMVSMVRSGLLDPGEAPPKLDTEVVRIIDKSHCNFCLNEIEYAEYFKPGDEYELINNNGEVYKTKVMSAQEAPDTENIYFSLVDADATLAVGTRAYARLVLDSRKDVLTLPKLVVHRAGEESYVYYEDENGLKSVRYVTTGLEGSKLVEIVDGLEEGDMVIKR